MSKKSKPTLDFGLSPDDNAHHFLVYQKSKKAEVLFFEEYTFNSEGSTKRLLLEAAATNSSCKCILNAARWELLKDDLKSEFNRRLRSMQLSTGRWKAKETYLHRLLGKEMMVLVWAIEDADPNVISTAVHNWLGFRPEERWWLYTMANAATGHAIAGKNKGWRKALRFALTENPINYNRVHDSLSSDDGFDTPYGSNNLFE